MAVPGRKCVTMALNPQFKVNQLAKDLGMKSKELTDILTEKGVEVKTQRVLEPREFELLWETLTSQNQIENIEDYLDGVTHIPSAKPAEKKEEPKKAEEQKPAEAPKAEEPKKVEAPKAEEPKKVETPKVEEPKKAEAPKAEEPKKVEAPKVEESKPAEAQKAQPKEEPKKEQQPKVSKDRLRPGVAAAAAAVAQPAAPAQNPQNRSYPGQNGAPNGGSRFQGGANGQRQMAPGANGNRPGFRQNGAPQNGRPAQQGGRPMQNGDRAQGGNQMNRPQRFDNNRGGFDNKGFDDKGPVQSAPKEKFQPQAIVRAQTAKGSDQKQKGATRVVDTRSVEVDLSKYDERLDNFVPESVSESRPTNQKLKKQPQSTRGAQVSQKNSRQQPQKKAPMVVKKVPLNVQIPEEIVVSELASRLKVTAVEVVKQLMLMGSMVTVNQAIDYDTAALVAEELGAIPSKEVVVTIEEKLFDEAEDTADQLLPRAPVVCVMGHVDHGKTSLLDAIRHTRVTAGEAGGITQVIGAYRVKVNGQDLTFLDTPGHEAFTAMRARGAQATDIAILVVAADDGIMPQTVEAINHAKAAGIDIVVAINKMDKPGADPDNIKQELTKYDLVPEEWGGDVMCVPVSAMTGKGIDDLLETVLLVAEVKELKANPNRRAKGVIIEAKLDRGRGPVATVLVQNGTLNRGDIIIAGTAVGRVRAMTDYTGRTVKTAGPSVPVEIIGLAEVPMAGDDFQAVEDERMARTLAEQRRAKAKEETFRANARASLDQLFSQISEGVKDLNIIVKADVNGSAEALKQSLEKISNEEVRVRVIHAAAGAINEGDVMLAAASNAIIVGFNVRPDRAADDSAERQGVEIRTYRVIYECIEEITAAMKGMLAPKFREKMLGHCEVRQLIHVPNVGFVAGSYVQDGKVIRNAQVRLVRDGIVVCEDKIASLRRFKDDVKEVGDGYECGITLERYADIKLGDIFEVFMMEEIEQK